MRPFHAALGLAFGLLPLTAAEPTYGLGLSLKQNEQTIYAPIQLTPALRLEGSLAFNHQSRRDSYEVKQNTTSAGAGIFHVRHLSEGFHLYAGPRFTYTESSVAVNGVTHSRFETYGITPLLGLEYRLSRNLSLGGEAGVNFSRTNDKQPAPNEPGHQTFSGRESSTHTAVTLRYWF